MPSFRRFEFPRVCFAPSSVTVAAIDTDDFGWDSSSSSMCPLAMETGVFIITVAIGVVFGVVEVERAIGCCLMASYGKETNSQGLPLRKIH